jgi:hypothetical protein
MRNAAAYLFAFLAAVIDHEIQFGGNNRQRGPREAGKLMTEKREFE